MTLTETDAELHKWLSARENPLSNEELLRKQRNRLNNAQGQYFEQEILAGCSMYAEKNIAYIDKTPEPFRVMKKAKDGIFTGRFSTPAQPDFQGTLAGGQSIMFEAKQTGKDRINRNVLTETQMKVLEKHSTFGALCAVCICIQENFFFVPWETWRDMKSIYGRKYLRPDDICQYRIKFDGAVHFLQNVVPEKMARSDI